MLSRLKIVILTTLIGMIGMMTTSVSSAQRKARLGTSHRENAIFVTELSETVLTAVRKAFAMIAEMAL